MPWKVWTAMSLRQEFVQFAGRPDTNVAELCRRYGISRKTGYKWLGRAQAGGAAALADHSRRPHTSPTRTPAVQEAAVIAVRQQHPAWGARKLHRVLRTAASLPSSVPAPSTITGILRRHGLLPPPVRARTWQRFTAPAPNALWQMDFKGAFATGAGACHPLTVLDDHSRFNLCLVACADEQGVTVRQHLTTAFQRYGLPERMLMDNGRPWGYDSTHHWTALTVWLARLDIAVSHGRPYHPQTQGKEERFHRTLRVEVLAAHPAWPNLASCQRAFDAWRPVYNGYRPHESLDMRPPAAVYHPSSRAYPPTLPPIEYAPGDLVRKVQDKGLISFRGKEYAVGTAFRGLPVALRPTATDGQVAVYFCHQQIARLDLRREAGVS
jgi:transposase InsO family protein